MTLTAKPSLFPDCCWIHLRVVGRCSGAAGMVVCADPGGWRGNAYFLCVKDPLHAAGSQAGIHPQTTMHTPLQITFRHMDPSPALEMRIRREVAGLEDFSARIGRCHVIVDAPHQHQRQGQLYQVNVHLTVPSAEIIIDHTQAHSPAHEDVYIALRDAFRAARRRLEDYERVRRHDVKAHVAPGEGTICELDPTGGFGRIQTNDGRLIYFHRNSVVGMDFKALVTGMHVRFAEEQGDEGPQARSLHVLGTPRRSHD